jgi:hypothetical protein
MKTDDKIILDLCGGTGAWSKPYKDAGYDVRVITLPEHDVRTYNPPENIYGILAAPPCTEFSVAKNGSHRKRDLAQGMEIVEACLNIIWYAIMRRCGLKFWALENPRGYLRRFLGKAPFCFEQWQFGDLGIKPTEVWGFYNIPPTTVSVRPEHLALVKRYASGKLNSFSWGSCPEYAKEYAGKGYDRAALRSITPPGFARAFFKANP